MRGCLVEVHAIDHQLCPITFKDEIRYFSMPHLALFRIAIKLDAQSIGLILCAHGVPVTAYRLTLLRLGRTLVALGTLVSQ